MKAFMLSVALLLTCSAAHAGSLAQPVSYFSPHCGYAPVNVQTVTGFSQDGNYVYVTAKGRTACGSSGRAGGSISYVYWCEQLTYDLGGHLAMVTPLEPATIAGFNNCPWADPYVSFTSGSYMAWTDVLNWNATLTAPYLVYAPPTP